MKPYSIPDATFFVRRLTEAVDALWPPLERSLRTTMSRELSSIARF